MSKLILGIFALYLGSALYPYAVKKPKILDFLDAFVLITVSGLALTHLVPESVRAISYPAVIAFAIGLAVPVLFHISHKDPESHNAKLPLILATVGLLAHTVLDGLALSMGAEDASNFALLATGTLVHRFPVGLFIAWMIVPKWGYKLNWFIITSMAAGTVVGYIGGFMLFGNLGMQSLYFLQALITGALLHVLVHNISNSGMRSHSKYAALAPALGTLAGVAALFAVHLAHEHEHVLTTAHARHLEFTHAFFTYLAPVLPFWFASVAIVFVLYRLRKQYPKIDTVLRYLDPPVERVAREQNKHHLQADAVLLALPLLGWLPGILFHVLRLLCARLVHILMPEKMACECCDASCGASRGMKIWLMKNWTSLSLGLVGLIFLTSLGDPSLCFFTNNPLLSALLLAALGMTFPIPNILLLFAMTYMAVIGIGIPGVIAFGLASSVAYGLPENLEQYNKILYYKINALLFAVYSAIAVILTRLLDLKDYILPLPRHGIVEPVLLIAFIAAGLFVLFSYGPRKMLNHSLLGNKEHDHAESDR